MGCTAQSVLLSLATVLLAYFVLLPILTLIITANELLRFILKIFLYCSRSHYELISNGVDSIYPTDPEEKGGLMLGILGSSDINVNLQNEQTNFEISVLQKPGPVGINGPRMYERLEKCLGSKWGYRCRKRGNFKIENHVKLWTETIPANGEFYTEQEFQREIIQKLSDHMDYSSKPGWEWVIIPKVQLDPNDMTLSTVRVFRIHHSYMDGISAALLVSECLMDFPDGSDTPPFIVNPKAKLPKDMRTALFFSSVKGLIFLPYYLMKGIFAKPRPVKDSIFAGNNAGEKHYGVSRKMMFSNVRQIRTKLSAQNKSIRVSTTNVIASIIVSALVQFLDEIGKLEGHSMLATGGPVAILPHKDSRPRTQVLPSLFYIPLKKTAEMELVTVSGEGGYSVSLRYFVLVLGRFPSRIFEKVLSIVTSKFPCSAVITSVPTLRLKGHLRCGGLVNDVGGWSVIQEQLMGLSITVMSYEESLRFWCVVDDAVMNRVEFDRFLQLLTEQNL